jgi:hypothetical protein
MSGNKGTEVGRGNRASGAAIRGAIGLAGLPATAGAPTTSTWRAGDTLARVSELLTRCINSPGLYVGRGDGRESGPFIGRLVVEVLPSGAAVSLAYEAYGDQLLQHAELSVMWREPSGRLGLFVVHSESPAPAVMSETSPGFFMEEEPSGPYQQAVGMEFDGDVLSYAWWWAPLGQALAEQSRAVLRREDRGGSTGQ